MKVLILTHLDATNYSIVEIVRTLKQRGHEIEGYGRFLDEHNIKMFKDILKINPIDELTDEKIEYFDIIFSSLDVIDCVRNAKKYIFCYNFLFCGNLIADCGDFMFTQCDERNLDYAEECATMSIGNPKFTEIEKKPKTNNSQILFIDSGHYPFGIKGRKILAQLLIDISKKYSDYKLVIKPRFLINEENVTHRNDDHLYNVIEREAKGDVPQNIVMLQEHLNMNELIDQSDIILCLYTTAFIDVLLRGKKLIIIDGLPNEDTYDLRNDFHWKKQRETLEKSECLCHYSEVMDLLPNGFETPKEKIKTFVKYNDGASERVVNVMEYIWENYLKNNKFPGIMNWEYENYKDINISDDKINWDFLIVKRYKNKLRFNSRFIDYISGSMGKKEYMSLLDDFEQKGLISNQTFREIVKLLNIFRNNIWISEKEKLWSDDIDQSFVLWALYENHCYEELKLLPFESITCKSQYNYIMGRVSCDERKFEDAIRFFEDFLIQTRKKPFAKYFTDQLEKQISGVFFGGVANFELKNYTKAYECFTECQVLTNNKHRKAAEYIKLICEKYLLEIN